MKIILTLNYSIKNLKRKLKKENINKIFSSKIKQKIQLKNIKDKFKRINLNLVQFKLLNLSFLNQLI